MIMQYKTYGPTKKPHTTFFYLQIIGESSLQHPHMKIYWKSQFNNIFETK